MFFFWPSIQCYNWLHKVCKKENLDGYEMSYIHKLLFNQYIKTQTGVLFTEVAHNIETELGQIEEVTVHMLAIFRLI